MPKPITERDERFYDRGKEAGRSEVLKRMRELGRSIRGKAQDAGHEALAAWILAEFRVAGIDLGENG